MLKRCPGMLAGGVVLSTLLLGYSNGEMGAARAQNGPAPGLPGSKAPGKAPGAPGKAPGAGGKKDPFAPKGPGAQMPGQPGGPKGGPGRGGPISRGGGAPGAPGAPGKLPGAPGAAGAAGAVATLPPIKSKRKFDPFVIDWKKLPPPPYIFDNIVGPVRVASVDVEIPPVGEVTVREVPNRRVSGIMSGDGVFAILEAADGSVPDIVKPGMTTKDGYKVVSITADSVTLERKDGNVTRTQQVPLTDQSFGGASATGGGGLFGGGNQTGRPGGLGTPGGLPGSGGPRRPIRGGVGPGAGGPNGKE